MMAIYWLFQRDNQFLVALKIENEVSYYADVEGLKNALASVKWLIGYGSFKELALLISDGKSKYLNQYLLIDLSQELGNRTIEEIGFINNFDLKAKNAKEYCLRRIEICEFIFDEREEYIENKLEIINEFDLKSTSINKTRANLSVEVLKAIKQPNRANILMYEINPLINQDELPERLVDFYKKISKEYKNNLNEKLVKNKMKITLAGLTHTFGFGGVHAAIENYQSEGIFLHIDVKSFYTSLMINHNYISSAIKEKERVIHLHEQKNNKGKNAYKTVINAIVGSMNNPYSKLYDPKQFYSITVNGQLMMAHLICILENFIIELVQTNTDGIVVKVEPAFVDLIQDIVELWSLKYKVETKITVINKVVQKNVNNYIMVLENGSMWRTGIYAEQHILTSSIKAVSEGIMECQLTGIKPQDFFVEKFKTGKIEEFYFIGSRTKDSDGLVQEVMNRNNRDFRKVNDTVCGIATNNKQLGSIYQNKKGLHSKLTGCPDNFMSYTQAGKKDINLSWYVDQVEKVVF